MIKMEPDEEHTLSSHEGHSLHGLLHAEDTTHGIRHGGHKTEKLHHQTEEREDSIITETHHPLHELIHEELRAEGSLRFHSGPRHHWTDAHKYETGHHEQAHAIDRHAAIASHPDVHHEKLHLHSAHAVAEEIGHRVIPAHEHRVEPVVEKHEVEVVHEAPIMKHHLSPVIHRKTEDDHHDEELQLDSKQEDERKQEMHKATLHTVDTGEHASKSHHERFLEEHHRASVPFVQHHGDAFHIESEYHADHETHHALDHAHDEQHDIEPVHFHEHAIHHAFDHPDSRSYEHTERLDHHARAEYVEEPLHMSERREG